MVKPKSRTRWTKERFYGEKHQFQLTSLRVGILITALFACILLVFKTLFLLPFCFFVWFLTYAIVQRRQFLQWKKEIIADRKITHQEFEHLSSKYNSEEKKYFTTGGIALWCIGGFLLLGICTYVKMRNIELDRYSALELGKVVEIGSGKSGPYVQIEFVINGKPYTTTRQVYKKENAAGYFYSKANNAIEVQIGDELKIRYSLKDPENCEATDDPPVKQEF